MTVQVGLCRTCSDTTLLVFPRGGSFVHLSYTKFPLSLLARLTTSVTRWHSVACSSISGGLLSYIHSIYKLYQVQLEFAYISIYSTLLDLCDFCCRNLQAAICSYYDLDQPSVKVPQLTFISDITVGDGEAVPPNTRFAKTWRISNSGNIRATTRENRSSGFPTRSDTNRAVESQKQARSLKFWI